MTICLSVFIGFLGALAWHIRHRIRMRRFYEHIQDSRLIDQSVRNLTEEEWEERGFHVSKEDE